MLFLFIPRGGKINIVLHLVMFCPLTNRFKDGRDALEIRENRLKNKIDTIPFNRFVDVIYGFRGRSKNGRRLSVG